MFEFVIPARNEEDRVGDIVKALKGRYGDRIRVVVADNASEDATAQRARHAGADEVVSATRIGKGYAVVAGLRVCENSRVLLCDADIRGLDPALMVDLLGEVERRDLLLGRLALRRAPEDAPVTTLTARPLLRQFGVDRVAEPLGGLAAVHRELVLGRHLPGDWGFDVALTVAALAEGQEIVEVLAPEVRHRHRPLEQYVDMANQVTAAILGHYGVRPWNHDNCTLCSLADCRVDFVREAPVAVGADRFDRDQQPATKDR